jgi:ubiquinone biosynthesis protein
MTRDVLERLSQPHRHDPPPPYRRDGDHWALRLLGAGLLAGGVLLAITHTQTGAALNSLSAWPALLMLVAGVYLVVRR